MTYVATWAAAHPHPGTSRLQGWGQPHCGSNSSSSRQPNDMHSSMGSSTSTFKHVTAPGLGPDTLRQQKEQQQQQQQQQKSPRKLVE
jgi:hypothetical protein